MADAEPRESQAAFARAKESRAYVVDEPHLNPKSGAIEFSVRDPDGYAITMAERRG